MGAKMKNIGKRIYDLIIKLISVKTIPAVIFSVGYLATPNEINAAACLLAWCLVVGFRYAEKVQSLVKGK
jgi:hypothetical protein